MIAHRVEDFTMSELLQICRDKAHKAYEEYSQAIKGTDEDLKDEAYKRWAHADDCLLGVSKLMEMVRSDIV